MVSKDLCSSSSMLAVEHLGYHPAVTPQPILSDICLTIAPSQLGVIVGQSGAGKTTLLEVMAGLAKPSHGEIRWQNQVLTPHKLRRIAGLVFQFPERHFCGFSVLEELRLGHPELQEKDMRHALESVGLGELPLRTSPFLLSGGQQRRLALAVQLVRSPFLLLLDEPTAGLDWSVRQQIVDLLARLKQSWSILVVTHDPAGLRDIADQQWQLKQGILTPLPMAIA